MASPTTPAAGSTQVSLRSTPAVRASLVRRSIERSGWSSVGIGLTTACARSSSPLVTPPSRPPAWLVGRSRPRASSNRISSWKRDPGRSAASKPAPRLTAFTAGIDISAWAMRPSRRRSHCANEPSPAGTPRATTSNTPPTLSPARLAASISATIAAATAGSQQRTGLWSTSSSDSQAAVVPAGAAR